MRPCSTAIAVCSFLDVSAGREGPSFVVVCEYCDRRWRCRLRPGHTLLHLPSRASITKIGAGLPLLDPCRPSRKGRGSRKGEGGRPRAIALRRRRLDERRQRLAASKGRTTRRQALRDVIAAGDVPPFRFGGASQILLLGTVPQIGRSGRDVGDAQRAARAFWWSAEPAYNAYE